MNDVWEYLHLPISEASKKLNVCNTVLKKICRRSGLSRWPYRKVALFFFFLKSTLNFFKNQNFNLMKNWCRYEVTRGE